MAQGEQTSAIPDTCRFVRRAGSHGLPCRHPACGIHHGNVPSPTPHVTRGSDSCLGHARWRALPDTCVNSRQITCDADHDEDGCGTRSCVAGSHARPVGSTVHWLCEASEHLSLQNVNGLDSGLHAGEVSPFDLRSRLACDHHPHVSFNSFSDAAASCLGNSIDESGEAFLSMDSKRSQYAANQPACQAPRSVVRPAQLDEARSQMAQLRLSWMAGHETRSRCTDVQPLHRSSAPPGPARAVGAALARSMVRAADGSLTRSPSFEHAFMLDMQQAEIGDSVLTRRGSYDTTICAVTVVPRDVECVRSCRASHTGCAQSKSSRDPSYRPERLLPAHTWDTGLRSLDKRLNGSAEDNVGVFRNEFFGWSGVLDAGAAGDTHGSEQSVDSDQVHVDPAHAMCVAQEKLARIDEWVGLQMDMVIEAQQAREDASQQWRCLAQIAAQPVPSTLLSAEHVRRNLLKAGLAWRSDR